MHKHEFQSKELQKKTICQYSNQSPLYKFQQYSKKGFHENLQIVLEQRLNFWN